MWVFGPSPTAPRLNEKTFQMLKYKWKCGNVITPEEQNNFYFGDCCNLNPDRVFWQTSGPKDRSNHQLFEPMKLYVSHQSKVCVSRTKSLDPGGFTLAVEVLQNPWHPSWHLQSGRLSSLFLIQWSGPISAKVERDERSVSPLKEAKAMLRMPSWKSPDWAKKLINRWINNCHQCCRFWRGARRFRFVWKGITCSNFHRLFAFSAVPLVYSNLDVSVPLAWSFFCLAVAFRIAALNVYSHSHAHTDANSTIAPGYVLEDFPSLSPSILISIWLPLSSQSSFFPPPRDEDAHQPFAIYFAPRLAPAFPLGGYAF